MNFNRQWSPSVGDVLHQPNLFDCITERSQLRLDALLSSLEFCDRVDEGDTSCMHSL